MNDYFSLFSFESNPVIDQEKLLEKYLDLQKKHHPDLSPKNAELIYDINKGYKLLSDDFSRIEYIIKAHFKGHSAETGDEKLLNSATLSEDFLNEMMSLQFEFEDLDESKKEEQLNNLLQRIDNLKFKTIDNIYAQDYTSALQHLAQWNFLKQLSQRI